MELIFIDWLLICLYISVALFIGFKYRKKAGKNLANYFLGGRKLPWFIAGISMVATTFAADTPLAVTEMVNNNGISGNWLWWNMLIGGMLTTFFFADLWRRANVLTELEFIEIRYSGKAAAFLRGFKSVYLGLFVNVLIISWVNLALVSILQVFFNISDANIIWYVGGAMLIASFYSSLSGLLGVAITDAVQFFIAVTGSVVLAVIILSTEQVGGLRGLQEQLPDWAFNFFPTIGSGGNASSAFTISIGTFLAYIGVQWWASWYPGAEPGGGGYVAQRMMSVKNGRHATWATLFFQIAHYVVRPWPWILVALATLILYPDLPEGQERFGYVLAIRDYLPAGLTGLMLVALLAAYMSTISTQLNWGASFIVNDFYKRFFYQKKGNNDDGKHLVFVSRAVTILIMIIALYVTTIVESITQVWHFLLECGAGLGLVLILRWYWQKINAWSEITATAVPFIVFGLVKFVFYMEFPDSFFITVGITTIFWIIVTYLTPETNYHTLKKFYYLVQPPGIWNIDSQIRQEKNKRIPKMLMCWLGAIMFTYSALFLSGKLLFGEWISAGIWFITLFAGFFIVKQNIKGLY
ncbi:MAG: sodium:solute symporter family protein [Bacteroidales bacterium]